jgi:hypothetical protein
MAGTASGAIAITALFIYSADGLRSIHSPRALALFDSYNDRAPRASECHYDGIVRNYSICIFGKDKSVPDLAVFGDSHGIELSALLGSFAGKSGRSVVQMTASACPPALGFADRNRSYCIGHNIRMIDYIKNNKNIDNVVLVADFSTYIDRASLDIGFNRTINELIYLKKKIFLIMPIVTMKVEPPARVGKQYEFGIDPTTIGVEISKYNVDNKYWRSELEALSAKFGLDLFDPATALCPGGWCSAYRKDSGVLYYDMRHLGMAGAAYAFDGLARKIYAVGRSP